MGVTAISELALKFKRTFISKKFIAFCALGVINTFNDSVFSSLYHMAGLQNNIAAVFGYYTALTIAFFLSSRFVFKKGICIKRYIRFLVSYIPNFVIFFLVTFMTINTWGLPQFWGTMLAAVFGGPITFVIMKIYTFSGK